MDPRDELLFLAEALRGHIETCADFGDKHLRGIDPATLQARRKQYREAAEADGKSLVFRSDEADEPDPKPTSSGSEDSASVTSVLGASGTLQELPPNAANHPHAAPAPAPQTFARPEEFSDGNLLATALETAVSRPPDSAPSGSPFSDTTQVQKPTTPSIVVPLSPPLTTEPTRSIDRAALRVLQEKVATCDACALHSMRTNTVFSRGTGDSGVCFIGEGPGADEDAQGIPFVGAAGQLLDKMISAMGLERDAVYVCNIVKCRPPKNRKPRPEEIAACSHYLEQQLEALRPKVMVAMGATAVHGLLGLSTGITRLRGQWRLYRGEIPVMPTFHPAYLLRQPSAKRQVWQDLQEVLREVRLPLPERKR